VRIVGLKARPDLNGKTGLVVGPAVTPTPATTPTDPKSGASAGAGSKSGKGVGGDLRACVVVDGGLGSFHLKTLNLTGVK